MQSRQRMILFAAIFAALFLGIIPARAEQNSAETVAENANELHGYVFKERMEVKHNGQDIAVRVSEVRFDSEGHRQATVISETHQDGKTDQDRTGQILDKIGDNSRPVAIAGKLRNAIANKKQEKTKEKAKEYVDQLKSLLAEYMQHDPEKLRADAANAEHSQEGDNLRLTIKNYIKSGDSVSLIVSPADRKLKRIEVQTTLENNPVSVVAEMAWLPNGGPRYASLTKITSPQKDLELDISRYDFMKAL